MKISIATTLALLIITIVLGKRQLKEISNLEKVVGEDTGHQQAAASSRLRVARSRSHDHSIDGITDEMVEIYLKYEAAGNSEERMKVEAKFKEALINLSPDELEGLFRKMREEPTLEVYSRGRIACYCLRLISDKNPQRALGLALESLEWEGFEDSSRIWSATTMALEHLAKEDPEAAWTWLTEHGSTPSEKVFPPRSRSKIANTILQEAASKDFSMAFRFLKNAQVENSDITSSQLASSLTIDRGPEYIKAIRDSNLPEEYRNKAFESLALKDLSSDYLETLQLLRDSKLTNSEMNSFAAGLRRRGGHSPQDPNWLDWIISQSGSNDTLSSYQKRLIISLQQSYTSFDYVAAGNWINAKPKGNIRNFLALRYAYNLRNEEPAIALEWAQSLPENPETNKLIDDLNKKLNPPPNNGGHHHN